MRECVKTPMRGSWFPVLGRAKPPTYGTHLALTAWASHWGTCTAGHWPTAAIASGACCVTATNTTSPSLPIRLLAAMGLGAAPLAKAVLPDLEQIALVSGNFLCHGLERNGPLSDQARNQFHKFLFRSTIGWILFLQR